MKARPLRPVRLTDVPVAQRLAAAQREARDAANDGERLSLFAAALAPSDRIYWIAA